jgi:3-oxoacyl-[acyl-carrier protein] reductase
MSDRYRTFAESAAGRAIVTRLGLPDPVRLRRDQPGEPLVAAPVLLGGGDRLRDRMAEVLADAGVVVVDGGADLAAIVYDATGLRDPAALRGLFDFFHRAAGALAMFARVVVFGTPPRECRTAPEAAAQQALTGFVGSVGKELGRGTTAQLAYVSPGAEDMTESTLRFLLSARSTCMSGQTIQIAQGVPPVSTDWTRPLAGNVALVTGASRGIGAAIATVLARDGAHVVCVDLPGTGEALAAVATKIGGTAFRVDLAGAGAPRLIADELMSRHSGVDTIVHNAGIDYDVTLDKMTAAQWDSVLEVNLAAPERANAVLVAEKILHTGGRIISVLSMNGSAGRRGRTSYAISEAGVLGLVEAQARTLAKYSVTANAVVPGFIEPPMTAAMPGLTREIARRLHNLTHGGLAQGGLPMDVAEAVGWLASPASGGVTGNVIRVCG